MPFNGNSSSSSLHPFHTSWNKTFAVQEGKFFSKRNSSYAGTKNLFHPSLYLIHVWNKKNQRTWLFFYRFYPICVTCNFNFPYFEKLYFHRRPNISSSQWLFSASALVLIVLLPYHKDSKTIRWIIWRYWIQRKYWIATSNLLHVSNNTHDMLRKYASFF